MPVDLVMATAVLVGRLQAKFWQNDELAALDWMPLANPMGQDYPQKWPSFVEHFGHYMGPDGIALGERIGPNVPWILNEIAQRPKTVTHNDLREDNLLFDESGPQTEVIILDWQLATRSMGVFDVARLMAASALPDLRRGHEIEILRAWHGALLAHGVTDYYWEEALYDLRLAMLEFILFLNHLHHAFIGGEGRAARLTEVIFRRAFATAIDLEAGVAMP